MTHAYNKENLLDHHKGALQLTVGGNLLQLGSSPGLICGDSMWFYATLGFRIRADASPSQYCKSRTWQDNFPSNKLMFIGVPENPPIEPIR